MNKLLKDAIADAKAVRETALANAKFALEEAFAPKLQSMLSHKIKEEMEGEEEEAPAEDDAAMESRMRGNAGIYEEDDDIFGDEEGEGASNAAGNDPEALAEEGEDEEMPAEEMPAEEPAEEEGEISDEELAELIRELEGEEEEEGSDEEESLEEGEDEEYEEAPKSEGKKKKMKMMEEEGEEEAPAEESDDEEVDLEEIIRALREEDEEGGEDSERAEKAEEELEEAYKVIKFLRSKLNEVNLLNAKLLYVNKLIKREGLTEGQKVKIIETFDRAKNVREAKLIYTTLAESVAKKAVKSAAVSKKRMVEGFASKAQKPTKILQENKIYDRFKTLVNFNR